MNQCERYELLISLSIDEEITLEEQTELDHHLAACPSCRAYLEDMRRVHQTFIREDVAVPEGFSARLMDRVRETKQDPVQAEKKKSVLFPHWRRWGALAACCTIVALSVWGFWEVHNGSVKDSAVSTDQMLPEEGMDTRSIITGAPAVQAAQNTEEAVPVEDDTAVVEPVIESLKETPPPSQDEYIAISKYSVKEDESGDSTQPAQNSEFSLTLSDIQEEPVTDAPEATIPSDSNDLKQDRIEYERDEMDIPFFEEGEEFKETEEPKESEESEEDETEQDTVEFPTELETISVPPANEPEEIIEEVEPVEVIGAPDPGILTAFGSAAQNWVETVLDQPWAGGGSYPLTAEQYNDLLQTLDNAGEPYRIEPAKGYCLMTE